MERTREEKLEIVLKHLDEGVPLYELASRYKIDISNIKYYVNLYLRHGAKVFTNSNEQRDYTREMKLIAIRRHLVDGESMRNIAVDLGLKDPGSLRDWVHKYKTEGEESIQTTRSRSNYLLSEERQDKIEDEAVKRRLEYLEAENEYLKKLYSRMLEGNGSSK
jgi:transposase